MARKTHGEKIDELSSAMSTITERVDHVRAEVEALASAQSEAKNDRVEMSTRIAILEQSRKEFQERASEGKRHLVTLTVAGMSFIGMIVAAIIGALLSPLVAELFSGA